MKANCGQIEERLSDYIEKSLEAAEAQEMEAHLQDCAKCAALEAQMRRLLGAMAEMEGGMEAPPQLAAKILEQTLGPRKSTRGGEAWTWLKSLWKPQVLVGMAGALATLALVAQFTLPARMRGNAATPAGILRSANRQAHLVYARGVKYVNDLRVVYEIQSRLRNEPEPSPETPQRTITPGPNDRTEEHHPGHSANFTGMYEAVMLAPLAGRSMR